MGIYITASCPKDLFQTSSKVFESRDIALQEAIRAFLELAVDDEPLGGKLLAQVEAKIAEKKDKIVSASKEKSAKKQQGELLKQQKRLEKEQRKKEKLDSKLEERCLKSNFEYFYLVPHECRECGHVFENGSWAGRNFDNGFYECPSCQNDLTNSFIDAYYSTRSFLKGRVSEEIIDEKYPYLTI